MDSACLSCLTIENIQIQRWQVRAEESCYCWRLWRLDSEVGSATDERFVRPML